MRNNVRFAEESEKEVLRRMINQSGVEPLDVQQGEIRYLVMETENGIEAMIGIHLIKEVGLLRTLIFSPNCKQQEVTFFFQSMIATADEMGLKRLYLVTPNKTFLPFFEFFHFSTVNVDKLEDSREVKHEIEQLMSLQREAYVLWHQLKTSVDR